MHLTIPKQYNPLLGTIDTELAIKFVKDVFQQQLSAALGLTRVSAPMMVSKSTGLNDDLNGVERPVQFDLLETGEQVQIVHSLAKWKRLALKQYGFAPQTGLYTDMNAIRRDEETDNLHSVYVDQWDWEKVITRPQRSQGYLIDTVRSILGAMRRTEATLCERFPVLSPLLPEDIFFITTQELENRYPNLTPKERENAITKEHGAVFLMQIGDKLKSGIPHDGRAPDYDDWQLNGDILVWYPVLECVMELSSMGIRVDEKSLAQQLKKAGCPQRAELPFHKMLLAGQLPLTIGGGIGQSRICMLLLHKAHIGEVHASIWPREMVERCEENGIHLL